MATMPAGSGGQRIFVDYAEVNQALAHLDEAYRQLDAAASEAAAMGQIRGAGREQPSSDFANVANPIAQQKITEIINQRDAVRAMYDTLSVQLANQRLTEGTNAVNHRDLQR